MNFQKVDDSRSYAIFETPGLPEPQKKNRKSSRPMISIANGNSLVITKGRSMLRRFFEDKDLPPP